MLCMVQIGNMHKGVEDLVQSTEVNTRIVKFLGSQIICNHQVLLCGMLTVVYQSNVNINRGTSTSVTDRLVCVFREMFCP